VKIFIDTANLREIKEACSWGIVDGLTTNPTLIRKAVQASTGPGFDIARHIEEICRIVPGPVSLEVIGLDTETMVSEARKLHHRFNPLKDNVVIKIPINTNDGTGDHDNFRGLVAIRRLADLGIPVNATLIMTAEQALLAAKAGARYVSPFMGRIDDFRKPEQDAGSAQETLPTGSEVVRQIATIFANYGLSTEIIAASIRHVGHVRAAALAGAGIATIPFAVLNEMSRHAKTEDGIRRFCADVIPEYSGLLSLL